MGLCKLEVGRSMKLESNVPLFNVKVDDEEKMSHLVTIALHWQTPLEHVRCTVTLEFLTIIGSGISVE